ncbi:MAG: hypothetical protein E6023_24220, partial [Pseudomonas aeruginosa]|nr:hypothetical protein [Pseudomonas aeruginosa]
MSNLLLSPLAVGNLALRNRIVMAPMTRSRAQQPGDVPTALNALYYAQRAGAGLIVSEGTQISRLGQGYAYTPGIYSEAQLAGWRQVTEAVHAAGGLIAAQLWHVGRMSHRSLQAGGEAPIAPSPIQAKAQVFIADGQGGGSMAPADAPREMTLEDIRRVRDEFVRAARNALDAGFDLVELHGANGYLIDQFLASASNRRSDAYGGSLENRARFLLEIVDALVAAVGKVHFGALEEMGEAQYQLGLRDKLMGQVNLVLLGREYANDGGSFTLTSGVLAEQPIRFGSSASMVNCAVEGFVRGAALE